MDRLSLGETMESWRIVLAIIILVFLLLYCFFGGKKYDNSGIQLLMRRCGRDTDSDTDSCCTSNDDTMSERTMGSTFTRLSRKEWIPTGHAGGKGSKTENICRSILEDHYHKKFPSMRLDILKNPDTGRNLELDCYCHELRLALEYNGIQHYKYPNRFHKTEDEFILQVARDQWKYGRCKEYGIDLIIVPYTVRTQDLRDFILQRLPKR